MLDYFSSVYNLWTAGWDIATFQMARGKALVFTITGMVLNLIVLAMLVFSLIRRRKKALLLFGVLAITMNLLLCIFFYLFTTDNA